MEVDNDDIHSSLSGKNLGQKPISTFEMEKRGISFFLFLNKSKIWSYVMRLRYTPDIFVIYIVNIVDIVESILKSQKCKSPNLQNWPKRC